MMKMYKDYQSSSHFDYLSNSNDLFFVVHCNKTEEYIPPSIVQVFLDCLID